MTTYGMNQEDYQLYLSSDEPPEGWVTYYWTVDTDLFTWSEEMWFPTKEVAKNYASFWNIKEMVEVTNV